jgi:hypothetical protein
MTNGGSATVGEMFSLDYGIRFVSFGQALFEKVLIPTLIRLRGHHSQTKLGSALIPAGLVSPGQM